MNVGQLTFDATVTGRFSAMRRMPRPHISLRNVGPMMFR